MTDNGYQHLQMQRSYSISGLLNPTEGVPTMSIPVATGSTNQGKI